MNNKFLQWITFFLIFKNLYTTSRLPIYICGLTNINDYNIFANAGWDGNWYVGYNQCWIKELPPAPKNNYRKAYIGAKLGRAKTRQKINRPIWEKEPIPGDIYIAISSTPSFPAEKRFYLTSTTDIPLEPDPENALVGVGESRWFWTEIPLDYINFEGPNYLCIYSPTDVFTIETSKANPIIREGKPTTQKKAYKIKGTVKGIAGVGIENIPVTINSVNFSSTTFTDKFGTYEFTLPQATYTTTINIVGYNVSPPNYQYTCLDADYTEEDFVLTVMGPILAGGWSKKKQEKTTTFLNTTIKGSPPLDPKTALATPISIFEPALAIKLIPQGTEQIINISLYTETSEQITYIFTNVYGNLIERCWMELSTDGINWQKYLRALYLPPFIFTLEPRDFPKGRYSLRICAEDIWGNRGYSNILTATAE